MRLRRPSAGGGLLGGAHPVCGSAPVRPRWRTATRGGGAQLEPRQHAAARGGALPGRRRRMLNDRVVRAYLFSLFFSQIQREAWVDADSAPASLHRAEKSSEAAGVTTQEWLWPGRGRRWRLKFFLCSSCFVNKVVGESFPMEFVIIQ
ncbi:hypothetical protein SEVIR_5G320800v4 [Setaria viridis]|uniref:Uncharacterized protein n=1 Tax=Setaria viridis TaxID=4556 RepID=A0A4U6UMG8_SETVI|nr:hypothetical protein SEVIR_5G320800v2 [Setaria viridis]